MSSPVLEPTLDQLQVERLQLLADEVAEQLKHHAGVRSAQVLVSGPLSRIGVYVWCQVGSSAHCRPVTGYIEGTLLPHLEEAIGLRFERREVRVLTQPEP